MENKNFKILITKEEIGKRVEEVANKINEDFGDKEPLNVICVLKGAVIFCTDLIKHLKMPVRLHFVRLSSYGTSKKTSGTVKPLDLSLPDFKGENVLIVEDIVDTGITMEFLVNYIKDNLQPKELQIASFADKKIARKNDIKPDYYCFDVDDKFLLGYGLDYEEFYRNLPYVAYIES